MKQLLTLLVACFSATVLQAQGVGIGTNTPHASAQLDISSSNKGLLMPRITSTQRVAIPSPANGLMVYDTNLASFYYYNGTAWIAVNDGSGSSSSSWTLSGADIYNSNSSNVGVGTNEPTNKLQVNGNFLVTEPKTTTSSQPTAAQTKTIVNGSTVLIPPADSTCRIYDPGGPSGNYLPNLSAEVYIEGGNNPGMEITIEGSGLGAGDSLIIKEDLYSFSLVCVAVGNNYTGTGKWVINSRALHILFKSNADASTGSGFTLLIKRLYSISSDSPAIKGFAGNTLFFDSKQGAFRSGRIGNETIGNYSAAIGNNSKATGDNSVAMGYLSSAAGDYSTAMGLNSQASGYAAFAVGSNARASGYNSIAMGNKAEATGYSSVALGFNSNATGDFSFAPGYASLSRGFAGCVMGIFNNPLLLGDQNAATDATPLLIVGNGSDYNSRSNALVVLKNGNIGIGTSSVPPDGNLVINDASNSIIQLKTNENSIGFVQTSGNNLRLGTNSGNSTGNVVIRLNGADRFTVFPNGNATLTGTLTQNSDIRFKENIQQLHGSLNNLMQLNGYQYNWKPELKRDACQQIGLIAQNVEKVFPQLVSADADGMKSVAYQNLIPVLIEAIKEQQQQIDAMRTELNKLKY